MLQEKGLSHRRSCRLAALSRSTARYEPSDKDEPLLKRIKELALEHIRYGYRRIATFLNRDGHRMSFGRPHRLWRQARRFALPHKLSGARVAQRHRVGVGPGELLNVEDLQPRTIGVDVAQMKAIARRRLQNGSNSEQGRG